MAITSTLNAGQVVTQAMKLIGVLDSRTAPSSEDMADGVTALNWMLKSWQADGMNLWRQTEATVTFPADTKTVTLDPYCIDVVAAQIIQEPTYQRWLQRWEHGQYVVLPNKDARGYPTIFVLDKQRAAVEMTVWPVQPEDIEITYTYARVIEDVTVAASIVDVPQDWLETVYYGLADRLLDIYSVPQSQPAVAQRITARAAQLYDKLLASDRPQSVFFQPWGATPPNAGYGG